MESRKFVTVFTQSANKLYSRLTQCNPLYPQQYYSHIHTQVTSRFSLLQCVLHVHLSFLLYWPASYEQLQLQLTDFTLMQLTTSQCHFPPHRPNINVQFANTWMCVLLLQWRTNIHPPVFTVAMTRHFDAVPLHDSKFISPILYPLLRSTNTYIQLRRSFWRQVTSSSTIKGGRDTFQTGGIQHIFSYSPPMEANSFNRKSTNAVGRYNQSFHIPHTNIRIHIRIHSSITFRRTTIRVM
jgi:hypothetical protein